LLAADVTACSLARFETGHQPFGKGGARVLEGPHHVLDDGVARKAVSERDAVTTGAAARPAFPRTQLGPGVDRRPPAPVQQGELSPADLGIAAEQDVNRLLGRGAAPQERQPDRSVSGVAEPLCGNGADVGFAVGNETAHSRELGLDGHAEVADSAIPSEDRVRHAPPTSHRAGLMLEGRGDAGTTRRGRTAAIIPVG